MNNSTKYKGKKIDIIVNVFSLAAVLGTFIMQLFGIESGFIVFAAILAVVLIYAFFAYYGDMFKNKFQLIEESAKNIKQISERLNIVEDKLNFFEKASKIESRVLALEEKIRPKKGAIDPRWIFIGILILLLILYLRTVGLI